MRNRRRMRIRPAGVGVVHYMRSKSSPYVSQVAPAVGEVVEAIASKTGEC